MTPPIDPDAPFDAPWQAQAFALTVALHRAGLFTWAEWTAALGTELARGAPYWDAWVAALERLAVPRAGIPPAPDDLAAAIAPRGLAPAPRAEV